MRFCSIEKENHKLAKDEDTEWLRQTLLNIMKHNGWSCETWARRAGVAPTTLTRFVNKQTKHVLSTSTLLKLEQAAGKPLLGQTAASEFIETNKSIKEEVLVAGNYIKEIRTKAGLSQRQLAEKLGFDHYGLISQIEAGAVFLSFRHWKLLCEITNTNETEFTHKVFPAYYPEQYKILMGIKEKDHAIHG